MIRLKGMTINDDLKAGRRSDKNMRDLSKLFDDPL